jgi:chromosome segregation ATPase
MSDELKDKLNSFVKYIIGKIDKKDLADIQKNYDELIEFYEKFSILSNEDFESFTNEIDLANQKIKEYEAQKEIDTDKINQMKTQISENYGLDQKYKELNENYNKLNQKYNVCSNESAEYQMKIKNNEKLITELQGELNKSKKENFEKFEKITELEKALRLNEIQLSQATEKINKFTIDNNDLTKTNNELRNNYLDQQKNYQNKLLVLERQLKNLTDANNNLLQENSEVQNKLKELQIYTSMARDNKKKLNKEDFSILETMSHRAECAELEVQKLLNYINELKALNEKLRSKIKPLEDYALLQIKHDHEINTGKDTIYDLKNKVLSEEEKKEIENLKNKPDELLQSLIKLKAENLELHNQLKDITIECNQLLRETKKKKNV